MFPHLVPLLLWSEFIGGCPLSMLLYISATIIIAIFFDADTRIVKVQVEDHEMKMWDFPDDITVFLLRDINCQNRIQPVLKSHEKASSSKTNFSKIQALWAGAYKNRIDKPGKMIWSQLYIKILGVHFDNSVLDNNNWDIINGK